MQDSDLLYYEENYDYLFLPFCDNRAILPLVYNSFFSFFPTVLLLYGTPF